MNTRDEQDEIGMNQEIRVVVMLLFSLMLMSTLHSNPIQAAEKKGKDRLAVIDLNAKYGVDKALAEALSVIIRDTLHSFGEYQVMSAEDIQQVASREQLMQAIGSDDAAGQFLVDFGRKLDSRFMVAGDVSKIGSTYTISLRMLDTKGEGAGVIKRVSENCKCEQDALIIAVQDVAAKLAGKPTVSAKKAEEEKKLVEERRKAAELEKQRVAELAENHRIAEEQKQKLAAEIEKLKKEKEVEAENNRLAEEKRKATELEKQRVEELAEERRIAEEQKQKLTAEVERLKKEKETPMTATPRLTDGYATLPSKTYTDPTIGMEFVLVPGGCFQMGDPFGDGNSNEKPVHEICVDSFYMGKYEVTQGEYQSITSSNPSEFEGGIFGDSKRHPAEKVSWNDTQNFIRLLNGKTGNKYRLPTEAEWEYTARSGGKNEKYSGSNDLDAVALDRKKSGKSTHPVGQKQPNGFGLYDMTGNVYEWCGDMYDDRYYSNSLKSNPEGPLYGSSRVIRGGGWNGNPGLMRTTFRRGKDPNFSNNDIGFRLALPIQR